MMPSTMICVAISNPRYPCRARSDASIVYATDDTGSAMIAKANAMKSTALAGKPTGAGDEGGAAIPRCDRWPPVAADAEAPVLVRSVFLGVAARDGSAAPMGSSAASCAELSRLDSLTYGSSQAG